MSFFIEQCINVFIELLCLHGWEAFTQLCWTHQAKTFHHTPDANWSFKQRKSLFPMGEERIQKHLLQKTKTITGRGSSLGHWFCYLNLNRDLPKKPSNNFEQQRLLSPLIILLASGAGGRGQNKTGFWKCSHEDDDENEKKQEGKERET